MEGQLNLLEDVVFESGSVAAVVDDYVKTPTEDVECLR